MVARKRKITKIAEQYLGEDNKRALMSDNSNQEKRNENICLLYAQGMPITEIGQLYSISKQRVSQILYSLGVSAMEKKKEVVDIRELEEWKAKAEKYRERARRNRELVSEYNLKVMSLRSQLELKNKKLKKVENFTDEIRSLQIKIANLTNSLNSKNRKIAQLEKEITELKNRKENAHE